MFTSKIRYNCNKSYQFIYCVFYPIKVQNYYNLLVLILLFKRLLWSTNKASASTLSLIFFYLVYNKNWLIHFVILYSMDLSFWQFWKTSENLEDSLEKKELKYLLWTWPETWPEHKVRAIKFLFFCSSNMPKNVRAML